jgi:hypothetical protein
LTSAKSGVKRFINLAAKPAQYRWLLLLPSSVQLITLDFCEYKIMLLQIETTTEVTINN